jgi:hypothetical protein
VVAAHSNQLRIATDTVGYDVEHLVARSLKQVLSADPKPWAFGLKANLSSRPIAAKLREADERRFAPPERRPWWRRLAG